MRINKFIIVLLCIVSSIRGNESLDFSVSSAKSRKMPLLLSVIGNSQELTDVAEYIKKDFAFSEQFSVIDQALPKPPGKKELQDFAALGYLLAVFINQKKDGTFEWRVYDTMQAEMVAGKEYAKRGTVLRGWAHNMADAIWPVLTGNDGPFSSKIAYCKQEKNKAGHIIKHICVADYDGSHEKVLVNAPTISVAPRWNGDRKKPLLFYTEHTNTNARLIAVDMQGKRRTASDFNGNNMLPAFSPDGKAVVYCSSRGDGRCQLYHYSKGTLNRITHNYGNNVSPTFSDSNNLFYFCSDAQTGNPQIYSYTISEKIARRITKGGFCTSPTYNPIKKTLAYTKMVHGKMQVFVYDETTGEHKQLTSDSTNKQGCSWSPCGNYLLMAVDTGNTSTLQRYNIATQTQVQVSNNSNACSYPAWSGQLAIFPNILS